MGASPISRLRGALLLIAGLLWSSVVAAIPDLPAIMMFSGRIATGPDAIGITAQSGDVVLVFAVADGSLVGHGLVGRDGQYQLAALRNASFNGAAVAFEMQQGRRRYGLLLESGTPVVLRFQGKLLPDRTTLNLVVGRQSALLTEVEAANPAAQRLSLRPDLPCDAMSDVNEDGKCDEADLAILRLYGGGMSRTVAPR